MAALTDFAENKLVDFILRGQALGLAGSTAAAGSGPSQFYIGLLTTMPTDTGGGIEVSATGTAYARVARLCSMANWSGTQGAGTSVASTGTGATTTNNIAVTFAVPTGNWGAVVGFGFWDAATGGNLCIYAPLTAVKTINNGDAAPEFVANTLGFQLDN